MQAKKQFSVLVLGGYGSFGKRISKSLAATPNIKVTIAGRNKGEAEKAAQEICAKNNLLKNSDQLIRPQVAALDVRGDSKSFEQFLQGSAGDSDNDEKVQLVINTVGPFQRDGNSSDYKPYEVAKICIENGVHYIDLADGRDFVEGFQKELDDLAKKNNVVAITGASSVPGLSSAVVKEFEKLFDKDGMTSLEYSISPGNRAPRGVSTVKSVLSYCGEPIQVLKNGKTRSKIGWLGLKSSNFPVIGRRWVSYCDVPDLSLFRSRYPSLQTILFRAGMELKLFQVALYVFAWVRRHRLLFNFKWSSVAEQLTKLSDYFYYFGTDAGGMFMNFSGMKNGAPHLAQWAIIAAQGDGPQIPCHPSILLARKLARGGAAGEEVPTGARPCLEEFSVQEFISSLQQEGFAIEQYSSFKTLMRPYQIACEPFFSNLSPFLQTFHADPQQKHQLITGWTSVTRGKSIFANLYASFMKFPHSTPRIPLALEIELDAREDGTFEEKWIRKFGSSSGAVKVVTSREWVENGLLFEAVGPFKLGFMLKPIMEESDKDEKTGKLVCNGFEHVFVRAYIGNIPIPRILSPRAEAVTRTVKGKNGWQFSVKISAPLIGELIRYEGEIEGFENNPLKQ